MAPDVDEPEREHHRAQDVAPGGHARAREFPAARLRCPCPHLGHRRGHGHRDVHHRPQARQQHPRHQKARKVHPRRRRRIPEQVLQVVVGAELHLQAGQGHGAGEGERDEAAGHDAAQGSPDGGERLAVWPADGQQRGHRDGQGQRQAPKGGPRPAERPWEQQPHQQKHGPRHGARGRQALAAPHQAQERHERAGHACQITVALAAGYGAHLRAWAQRHEASGTGPKLARGTEVGVALGRSHGLPVAFAREQPDLDLARLRLLLHDAEHLRSKHRAPRPISLVSLMVGVPPVEEARRPPAGKERRHDEESAGENPQRAPQGRCPRTRSVLFAP